MTWNRREILSGLGIASAQALLWTFGCSGPQRPGKRAPDQVSGEVRTWLHEAIALLAGAGLTGHALAVSRRRTTAAHDLLGAHVAHGRSDGVVLTVQQPHGAREQVTSELTREGVEAAARLLAGKAKPAPIDFGPAPAAAAEPARVVDDDLLKTLTAIDQLDVVSSRIVYAANLVDIDDAMVWSVAAGRDLEQRLYRVRRALTRVAWNGTRPIVTETSRAWTGGLADQTFSVDEIAAVREAALLLMTPGAFDDGEHAIVLAPNVVAAVIDAAASTLLTTRAQRRPEVGKRLAIGASIASPVLTLVDDPTVAGAYGSFQFDDDGTPAAPVTLLDHGVVVGVLARGRRPGHVGPSAPMPSHLRLAPGTVKDLAVDAGYLLEGAGSASVDASSDRVVVAVQRAHEIKGGKRSGRVFADVELVGELGALLASVTDASIATETFGVRDDIDGQPQWRSIEAPFVRGKGSVRARRRAEGA